jgi:hypothetical protein
MTSASGASCATATISARGIITSMTRCSRRRRIFITIAISAGVLSRKAGPSSARNRASASLSEVRALDAR